MGLRDVIRAIWEYPSLAANLESARTALNQSEQKCRKLLLEKSEQSCQLKLLTSQSAALQAALTEFCPQISSAEEMKRLYDAISPSLDSKGFGLYHTAEQLTGLDVPSFFSYEDNRDLFEGMDGWQLLRYLTAAYFHAVDWTAVPGTTLERATLREVDTATLEYHAFEWQLYGTVLECMGFQDILASRQEEVMELIPSKGAELKFYAPLSGKLRGQELDDSGLLAFQNVILHRIENEHQYLDTIRGLMAGFDGLDCVNDKVYSVFPSVESINGRLYGVAVCHVKRDLNPGELEQLREFCADQFSYGWGEDLREYPCQTEREELRVSFCQDSGITVLTKEELDAASTLGHVRRQPKRGGESR